MRYDVLIAPEHSFLVNDILRQISKTLLHERQVVQDIRVEAAPR